ncbi:tRNA (N(6)-L-threonylcarbamoyladenosine(37)-C(2))-methylthiotransferase [uncultured Methanomethylovorans sp.]|uniref:tRNA (N(6)-L-threonylcarbamoyladenosine(37)-C(2))- methylthiotransferase n=1 Tax=uncultured Methanomethylovorans sp. TaxID=183759 RepID=UPI002AA7DACD|nr:tRNA (N(6)-L-threonylcarbamoyladenosine(37)-C(2))-methylthiotransferase [uncultured Methanomethylovorans sp.]
MKVHVSTFGCSANQASAEVMMATIRSLGHELVSEKNADVVVLNTCTVKYSTEQKILHKIWELGEKGREVVVAGCMPEVQLEDIIHNNPAAHILGVNSISRIGDILNSIASPEISSQNTSRQALHVFSHEPQGFINVPRFRFNSNIHICQLSQGCNNACSYCIVRFVRGPLRSFNPDPIVEDIRQGVAEGCREIWLTSQDNAQYGMDLGYQLPQLLERICDIPGDFKVRVGMMNPFSVLPILDELLNAFEHDKIYKLVHLPIQSASNDVLKKMNRFHSIEEANHLISCFRDRFDDLTLFTDIIVGFPGEKDTDFMKTVEWVKEYRPEKVNISRYTPRPHTKALEYRNIDSRIVAQRSNELHSVCEKVKIAVRKSMMGWTGRVFISKEAKVKGLMARTASYKPVVIPESSAIPGSYCEVEIFDATPGYFLGRVNLNQNNF